MSRINISYDVLRIVGQKEDLGKKIQKQTDVMSSPREYPRMFWGPEVHMQQFPSIP